MQDRIQRAEYSPSLIGFVREFEAELHAIVVVFAVICEGYKSGVETEESGWT
jgi:hypothetical protein